VAKKLFDGAQGAALLPDKEERKKFVSAAVAV
jgi:hypothetical protein